MTGGHYSLKTDRGSIFYRYYLGVIIERKSVFYRKRGSFFHKIMTGGAGSPLIYVGHFTSLHRQKAKLEFHYTAHQCWPKGEFI